jgi:signal transduction histidine kinase
MEDKVIEAFPHSEHIAEKDLQRTLLQDLVFCQPYTRIGRHFRGIIHNLNGRLQCALLQVELLQMVLRSGPNSLDPEQVQSRLEHLAAELDSLSEMLRFWGQQVDYESLLQEGWVDVNKIIRKALTFMHADLFFKHQVSTRTNLQEDLPMIYGNEFALANVFGPLLENSVAAMRYSDQRQLVVTTNSDGREVLVAIEHTGCPLEEGTDDDLFSPALKAEHGRLQSETVMQLHNRLGLYLANHTVRPCGGVIACENRSGHSVFTVRLPLKQHGDRMRHCNFANSMT